MHRRIPLLRSIAEAAFATVSVIFLDASLLGVPLYVPYVCADCARNVPQVPIIPFALSAIFALVDRTPSGSWREQAGRALALGVLVVGYAGLVHTATIPFIDPYFTMPYRVYAVLFLAATTMALVAFLARRGRTDTNDRLAIRIVFVAVAAAALALTQRQFAVAAAAVAGVAFGLVVERTIFDQIARRVRTSHILGVAVGIAITFRLVFGLQTLARTGPGLLFAYASDDGESYFRKAVGLVADPGTLSDVLSAKDGFPPLYSVFLAAIFGATGGSLEAVIAIQALLAGATTVLIYLLAKPLAGAAAAVVAAVLFAMDQNMIQNNSTLTTEALLMPLLVGGFGAVSAYRRRADVRLLITGAIAFALVFVTRNLLALAVAATAFWLTLQRRTPLLLARDVAILVLALLVAASPVAVATAAIEGHPRLTNQLADTGFVYEERSGHTIENGFLVARGIDPFTNPARSAQVFLSDPLPVLGFFAVAVPHRISYLLFSVNPGSADPLTIVNPASYPNRAGQLWQLLGVAAVLVALTAMVRARAWKAHREIVLLIAFVALYLVLFSVVFPPRQAFRYRIPIVPFIQIAQAAGLVILARWAFKRDGRLQ